MACVAKSVRVSLIFVVLVAASLPPLCRAAIMIADQSATAGISNQLVIAVAPTRLSGYVADSWSAAQATRVAYIFESDVDLSDATVAATVQRAVSSSFVTSVTNHTAFAVVNNITIYTITVRLTLSSSALVRTIIVNASAIEATLGRAGLDLLSIEPVRSTPLPSLQAVRARLAARGMDLTTIETVEPATRRGDLTALLESPNRIGGTAALAAGCAMAIAGFLWYSAWRYLAPAAESPRTTEAGEPAMLTKAGQIAATSMQRIQMRVSKQGVSVSASLRRHEHVIIEVGGDVGALVTEIKAPDTLRLFFAGSGQLLTANKDGAVLQAPWQLQRDVLTQQWLLEAVPDMPGCYRVVAPADGATKPRGRYSRQQPASCSAQREQQVTRR
jgi:hypothetical protein